MSEAGILEEIRDLLYDILEALTGIDDRPRPDDGEDTRPVWSESAYTATRYPDATELVDIDIRLPDRADTIETVHILEGQKPVDAAVSPFQNSEGEGFEFRDFNQGGVIRARARANGAIVGPTLTLKLPPPAVLDEGGDPVVVADLAVPVHRTEGGSDPGKGGAVT